MVVAKILAGEPDRFDARFVKVAELIDDLPEAFRAGPNG